MDNDNNVEENQMTLEEAFKRPEDDVAVLPEREILDLQNMSAEPEPEPEVKEEPKAEVEEVKEETEVTDEVTETEKVESEPRKVPLKELISERKKRQEAEAELTKLKDPNLTEQEKLDLFSDPEAYQAAIDDKIQHVQLMTNIKTSEYFAKQAHKDYTDVVYGTETEEGFLESDFAMKMKASPALQQEIFASENPAAAAYEAAKNMTLIKEISSMDDYKSQLKEEIRKELLSEMGQAVQKEQKLEEEVPVSLSNLQSKRDSGQSSDATSALSLNDILKG